MKRIAAAALAALLLVSCFGTGAMAASPAGWKDYINVTGYDPDKDYMQAMRMALDDGSPYAMQIGAIYEQQRNMKIDEFHMSEKKTAYFTMYTTASEILAAIEREKKPAYSQEDLDLLSRIIYAEVGAVWVPDWVQQMVGSVVLNRVSSSYFPNTIREVIYQPGQYSPTWNGSISKKPDARTIANAKYLLEHGSICPKNVIGQNSVITGSGVYKSYYDSVLGTTVYFCYM